MTGMRFSPGTTKDLLTRRRLPIDSLTWKGFPMVARERFVRVAPIALIVAASVFVAGCSSGRSPSTSPNPSSGASGEITAIRAARVEQNRAIAAGDRNRVAEFWTDDVSARRGLGAAVAGRQAYLEILQPIAGAKSTVVYQRIPVEIEVSDRWPLAFETGTWAGHLGNVNGPDVVTGRYSAQWVKRDNRWLIRSEVFVALSCSQSGCDAQALP